MSIQLNTFFQNMSLLYAEDDSVSRTLYEHYFQYYFNTLYIVENGQQALDVYYNNKPDIVVLDINMPLINGLEVCESIRKEDKHTKIILLSARNDKQTLFKAIELDLITYLEKPVSKQQFNQALLKLASELHHTDYVKLWQIEEQSYCWHPIKRELFCNNDIISLTKKEKILLELLINSHHKKTSYQQIFAAFLEANHNQKYSEASIKSVIKKLRSKLPPTVIKNTYGLGYYLKKDPL